MLMTTSESIDIFYWKDKEIEYQNEFRLVILNKDIEEPFMVDIGDLVDNSFIITSNQLISNELLLSVKK